jgi:hypothetical protein
VFFEWINFLKIYKQNSNTKKFYLYHLMEEKLKKNSKAVGHKNNFF